MRIPLKRSLAFVPVAGLKLQGFVRGVICFIGAFWLTIAGSFPASASYQSDTEAVEVQVHKHSFPVNFFEILITESRAEEDVKYDVGKIKCAHFDYPSKVFVLKSTCSNYLLGNLALKVPPVSLFIFHHSWKLPEVFTA